MRSSICRAYFYKVELGNIYILYIPFSHFLQSSYHMNRQKKKMSHSSDEDDQVSIFDSEEEENKSKKKEKQKEKNIRKPAVNAKAKGKPAKTTAKSREKKLNQEQENIMKKIMGKEVKEEEKSHTSTQSEKKLNQEKIQENEEIGVKKEHIVKANEEEEQQDESNPYEEIGYDEYTEFNEQPNVQSPYTSNVYSQVATPALKNLPYSNTTAYNTKYTNPYSSQVSYTQPNYYQQRTRFSSPTPYDPFGRQFLPNQGYMAQGNLEIDPNIELNFEDFQIENYQQDQRYNDVSINMQQIEQLKKEIDYEKIIENQQDRTTQNKKFKQQRKAFILQEIEKLRKEYIELEDEVDHSKDKESNLLFKENCNLLKQWKYDPSLLKKKEKPKLPSEPKPVDQNPPKSKTEGRITLLNEVLAENPYLTQVEMADVLRAMDPVMNARIERSVVLRLLKMCGFKKKKVRGVSKERNTPLSINLRYDYAIKYREYLNQKFSCYYFDELIINEYFDKESGWCKAEGEVEFKPEKFIDRSVVILVMLSFNGTCKWDVKVGDYEPEEYCKTVNNLLKISGEGVERRLLIANPLPYRNPQYLVQLTTRRGWEMLVLPSDGLGLNPLQTFFSEVRQTMKRKRYDTIQTLFQSVVQVLSQGDKQQIGKKMLNRIDAYIEKAIRRQLL